jgi:hypothetical protein
MAMGRGRKKADISYYNLPSLSRNFLKKRGEGRRKEEGKPMEMKNKFPPLDGGWYG